MRAMVLNQLKDWVYVLLPPIFWGLSFVAIKIGLESFSPFTLCAIRFLFAGFPLILFYRFPKGGIGKIFAYSISIGVLQFGLLFLAIHLKFPAGLSSVLIQSQVYITIFFAWIFFQERVTLLQILGFFLSAVGLVVIGYDYIVSAKALAFVLILLSALSWSVGNTILKTFKIESFAGFIAWTSFISSVPLMIISITIDGQAQMLRQIQAASWQSILALIFMSLFATQLAFSLFSKAMLKHPANKVMPFAMLVPIFGLSSNAIFLQEELTFNQKIGSSLIILGLIIAIMIKKRNQEKQIS